ncbi:oxidoreductase-like domain-containing protein 1 [Anopheles bellator]|uniref:oxidoreductase-like domain-containing protein 1 n=1 Tax=Anopheles bellator TaxID=139047 RepID=UPI0026499307|nr:oxidoreductase-like domain-containing protein 1 [Anopheles bellator]XP_058067223.1 oxidoreductase-like domain-containing protein 1 [Anopheles bellator]
MNSATLRIRLIGHLSGLGSRRASSSSNGDGNDATKTDNVPELPPEPTTCCMSGCQNCVWIQYAAELTKILDDGGDAAREIVLQKITDPSLKMFLKMELQNMPPGKDDTSS